MNMDMKGFWRKIANNCRFHTSYQMHPLINKSCGFCSDALSISTDRNRKTGKKRWKIEIFTLIISGRKLGVTLIKSQYVIKLIKASGVQKKRGSGDDLSRELLRLKASNLFKLNCLAVQLDLGVDSNTFNVICHWFRIVLDATDQCVLVLTRGLWIGPDC